MKHTKGKWEFYHIGLINAPNGISIISDIDGNRQKICEMPVTSIDFFNPTNKDNIKRVEADAKLIAAAPDMLEALKEISMNIDVSTINNSRRTTDRWTELSIKASQAIEKATYG